MSSGERIHILTGDGMSSLTVDAITADDSGKYVVSVENVHGADCHFASVAVEGKTCINLCGCADKGMGHVSALTQSLVINSDDMSASLVAGPPDPPSGQPTVTASGPDAAVVEWSSPAFDGGCKVTGYIVEMKSSVNNEWTTVADGCHSLSLTVRNLQHNTRFSFRVRAANVHGASEPSCESDEFALAFLPQFEPRIVSIESGEVFKARYEVHEELGKGRYGVVHKVTDLESNQKLAAKFIRCIKIKDKEKVKEEIDIMNCLRHPKLLQLAAAFESPREVVMVLE